MAQTGTIRLLDDNGQPFVVRTVDGRTGSEFDYLVPIGGSFVLETDGSRSAVAAAWAIAAPGPGQRAPAGSGTFRFGQSGIVTTESGIAPGLPTTKARVYADSTNGHSTGIAFANPAAETSARITVRAFELDRVTPAGTPSNPLVLAPRGHAAGTGGQWVSGMPASFTGVLEIESDQPFVALTVRSLTNSRNDLLFTTFPVADANRPAPAPVIFPHLADGGGFRTELILLNAAGGSRSTIRLYDSAGQPLDSLQ